MCKVPTNGSMIARWVKLWGRVPWDVTMAYEHQKAIQRELDARIPRGLRGSKQNEFRFGVYFFLIQRHSFDASVTLARTLVRKTEPNFEPKVLPFELERLS